MIVCKDSFWRRSLCLLAQVSLPLGANVFFAWGPAPQIGLSGSLVAPVPTLFPHPRQELSTPAPTIIHTCANDYAHPSQQPFTPAPTTIHTCSNSSIHMHCKNNWFLKITRTWICFSLHICPPRVLLPLLKDWEKHTDVPCRPCREIGRALDFKMGRSQGCDLNGSCRGVECTFDFEMGRSHRAAEG